MKFNRKVCIGFRNIGDAADKGEFYEGTLAEGFKWLIEKCQAATIAKRFSIAIGRNKDDVMVQFESSSRGVVADSTMASVMSLLDGIDLDSDPLIDTDSIGQNEPTASGDVARSEFDTYQG